MTLVLAAVSKIGAVQVSDRLVSSVENEKAFDIASNKAIVYLAPDAVVSIAYSGIAYIESIPTDQWIAQTLTGLLFSNPREQPRAHLGWRNYPPDFGYSIEQLRWKLDSWFSSSAEPASLAPQVMIAGWHATRRTWRPIIWVVEYNRISGRYSIERIPSDYWWFKGQFYLANIPDRSELPRRDLLKASARLRECHNEESIEHVLVETIRNVAARANTVGPNCMSIIILPPWKDQVRVRYLPLETGTISQEAPDLSDTEIHDDSAVTYSDGPVYFSPWLILPDRVVPPSRSVGMGATYRVGSLSVYIETPDYQIPQSTSGAVPAFNFGRIEAGLDNIELSLSYSDAPEQKRRIAYSRIQRRPKDPAKGKSQP